MWLLSQGVVSSPSIIFGGSDPSSQYATQLLVQLGVVFWTSLFQYYSILYACMRKGAYETVADRECEESFDLGHI